MASATDNRFALDDPEQHAEVVALLKEAYGHPQDQTKHALLEEVGRATSAVASAVEQWAMNREPERSLVALHNELSQPLSDLAVNKELQALGVAAPIDGVLSELNLLPDLEDAADQPSFLKGYLARKIFDALNFVNSAMVQAAESQLAPRLGDRPVAGSAQERAETAIGSELEARIATNDPRLEGLLDSTAFGNMSDTEQALTLLAVTRLSGFGILYGEKSVDAVRDGAQPKTAEQIDQVELIKSTYALATVRGWSPALAPLALDTGLSAPSAGLNGPN